MYIWVCMCVLILRSNNTDLNSRWKKTIRGEFCERSAIGDFFSYYLSLDFESPSPHLVELSPFIFSS